MVKRSNNNTHALPKGIEIIAFNSPELIKRKSWGVCPEKKYKDPVNLQVDYPLQV